MRASARGSEEPTSLADFSAGGEAGLSPGLFSPGSHPLRVGTGDALFSVSPTPSVFDFEPVHHVGGRTAIRSTTSPTQLVKSSTVFEARRSE
jgi:hypothetical protein